MDDELSKLIGLIYEAVLDDGLWPEVLIRLAGLCGAHVPAIGFFDPATRQASTVAPRTDPADILKFETCWAERSSLFSDMAGVPLGSVVNLQELVPTSAMKATPVYNELLRPMGLGSAALLSNIAQPGDAQAVLGLYKQSPRHDQPFERDEVELVARVTRHITRAVELRSRMSVLRLRESAALLALERLRKGVLLLDTTGRILFANNPGLEMLAGAKGAPAAFSALAEIHRRKANTIENGEAIDLPRDAGRPPLRLTTMTLQSAADLSWLGRISPTVVVTITDPEAETEHRAALLQKRYGLTPAEAGFALEIAKGDGRQAAAKRRGISVSTAHTHLNRIFEKTGVTRQAELVRIVLGGRLVP